MSIISKDLNLQTLMRNLHVNFESFKSLNKSIEWKNLNLKKVEWNKEVIFKMAGISLLGLALAYLG